MAVEVEVRAFLSKARFDELLQFFKKESNLVCEDVQETHYLDCNEDLRIQQNTFFSKIWLKHGKLHDEAREEIEARFAKNDFEKLSRLLSAAGAKPKTKWFRKRYEFDWNGVRAMLDDTKGYGYIIELEKLVEAKEKERTLALLKQKMKELNVPITPREEFEQKFSHYEKNWKELTR